MTSLERPKDANSFLKFLERKIDSDLGFYFWKKYVSTAFWAQISMPINLSLTFITAVTTAQANSSGLIPSSLYSNISIAALIISVLNTFFRPHLQMMKNGEMMKAWSIVGTDFEEIFYNNMSDADSIVEYKKIQKRMMELRDKDGADTMNFLTDFIHFVARKTCLRKRQRWLDLDRSILHDVQNESTAIVCKKTNLFCCCSRDHISTVSDTDSQQSQSRGVESHGNSQVSVKALQTRSATLTLASPPQGPPV